MSPPSLPTRVAHAADDEHWFFGHRVFAELLPAESATGLLVLAATGRRIAPEVARILDGIAALSTVADARIWPFKVTRLAASYGGALHGLASGLLMLDGGRIGPWEAPRRTAELFREVRQVLGEELPEVDRIAALLDGAWKKRRFLPGFGVPLRSVDERFQTLRAWLSREGCERTGLPHFQLLERLGAAVQRTRGLPPNIVGGFTAVCLDLGFAPEELGALGVVLTLPCFVSHAVESAQQAPRALQSLPPACVDYRGPALRSSPRALARGGSEPR